MARRVDAPPKPPVLHLLPSRHLGGYAARCPEHDSHLTRQLVGVNVYGYVFECSVADHLFVAQPPPEDVSCPPPPTD